MAPCVLKENERITRIFLGGITWEEEALLSWVKKSVILSNMEGLVSEDVNVVLFWKWILLFAEGGERLWMRFSKENYGVEDNWWFMMETLEPYECSLWRGITNCRSALVDNIYLQVGNRKKNQFLVWYSGGSATPEASFAGIIQVVLEKTRSNFRIYLQSRWIIWVMLVPSKAPDSIGQKAVSTDQEVWL